MNYLRLVISLRPNGVSKRTKNEWDICLRTEAQPTQKECVGVSLSLPFSLSLLFRRLLRCVSHLLAVCKRQLIIGLLKFVIWNMKINGTIKIRFTPIFRYFVIFFLVLFALLHKIAFSVDSGDANPNDPRHLSGTLFTWHRIQCHPFFISFQLASLLALAELNHATNHYLFTLVLNS